MFVTIQKSFGECQERSSIPFQYFARRYRSPPDGRNSRLEEKVKELYEIVF